MKTELIATIEKFGYLKTPQFWVTIKKTGTDGSSRIGPFKSLKQCGNFLRTYPAEMPVVFRHFLGWDENERMIEQSSESYNFKLFGA